MAEVSDLRRKGDIYMVGELIAGMKADYIKLYKRIIENYATIITQAMRNVIKF